ncbi:aldo/keto reductase [Streptomyces muensis]|uniref:Aldo/keto reductase n=1 Tax=Streptomyces muensis TaxID=1077944 RepID=A0A9X1TQF8_STRM4|nr:aldo/keto reductase [Streptomyces muensis]MCF1592543.1 aldo/keto reductase [Streptomyces muensis]
MNETPMAALNNGFAVPQIGFGIWSMDMQTPTVLRAALEAGYRSFDTAAVHGTETAVGTAMAESGIPRDELFVTTKIWNSEQGYDSALRAFDASLSKLGLEYVDLYVIHWPLPSRDAYVDTWRAFEKILADGRVKAIGVSNFEANHLRRLLDETSVVPAVNLIELNPVLPRSDLRAFHAQHGITTWAWNALGQGRGLLDAPVFKHLARKYDKSAAQVLLRWHVQQGNLVAPKSVTPARMRENLDVYDFELDTDDIAMIATLETGVRTGPHPDEFDVVTWSDEERAALG